MRSSPPPPPDAFLEINGRKWRRSDPRIPPALRQQLVRELMAARRAVGAAATAIERRDARRRVQDAKVALGERGRAWWIEPSAVDLESRIDAAIRTLLRGRPAGGTICPSEAARVVDGESWRRLLAPVRERAVQLSQAGQLLILRKRQLATGDLTAGVLRYKLAADFGSRAATTSRDGTRLSARRPASSRSSS